MPGLAELVGTGSLRRGDAGEAVFALQRALSAAGFHLLPDGRFGGITDLAVKSFQTAHGREANGIVDRALAQLLDSGEPLPAGQLIFVDLMYGLGDASTSAGMDVLAAALRALSGRLVVTPTISWTMRDDLMKRVRARPRNTRNMIFANSMGANAIPMVTNACPQHEFELVGGYDPTIFWTCPAFQGRNVKHAINYHGTNWINPVGHARYTEAFAGQVEVHPTPTLHSGIDDDPALHEHTIDSVKERLAA